jgi:hypothetical protein|uniref:DUF5132 domain-containing protein n=1 Tax=Desulfobacca acetoxidans TaxID=60893 RepID=A0A7V6A6F4_9BACT
MIWAIISRPLAALATLAGVAILSPVLVPLTAAIVKPLVKPMTNLYLDIAEEIGEVVVEREKLKNQRKILGKGVQGREARAIEEGTAVLDQVEKLL